MVVRKLLFALAGAGMVVLVTGAAYALQGIASMIDDPDPSDTQEVVDVFPQARPTDAPEDEGGDEGDAADDDDDDAGDDGDDGDGEQRDNHGRVVSIAAKCDVKGRAHGVLVSSIAQDRDATVADAEEACAEAMAAAEADDAEKRGKPDRAAGPPAGTPPQAGAPGPPASAGGPPASVPAGPPAHAGGNGRGD